MNSQAYQDTIWIELVPRIPMGKLKVEVGVHEPKHVPDWQVTYPNPLPKVLSKVVSTHLWNTPLNLYQQVVKGVLS